MESFDEALLRVSPLLGAMLIPMQLPNCGPPTFLGLEAYKATMR